MEMKMSTYLNLETLSDEILSEQEDAIAQREEQRQVIRDAKLLANQLITKLEALDLHEQADDVADGPLHHLDQLLSTVDKVKEITPPYGDLIIESLSEAHGLARSLERDLLATEMPVVKRVAGGYCIQIVRAPKQ